MPKALTEADFRDIFLNAVPMIDLRAPIEFEQGSFATAESLPLMSNEERSAVGTCYKEKGQDAAIVLGHELVSGDIKQARMDAWQAFIQKHPDGALYCFRGGLRSRTTQQWILEEMGVDYPRIEGGYKALRRFLIDSTERLIDTMNFVVLSGRSGTGKTRLIHQIPHSIDLEGLANHRGSAFGSTTTPQPTQINFENDLAIVLLKAEAAGYQTLVVEDESRNVGSLHVPFALHEKMKRSPLVNLTVPDQDRIDITVQEYAKDIHIDYIRQFGEIQGFEKLQSQLLESLSKLRKRLGGARYQHLQQLMQSALQGLQQQGRYEGFAAVFGELLLEYYDPMYDYQMSSKQDRIIYNGSREAVLEYLLAGNRIAEDCALVACKFDYL